jgi:hypothetical protein
VIDETDSSRLENTDVAGDGAELPMLDEVDEEFCRGLFQTPGARSELSDKFAGDTEICTDAPMLSSGYAAGRLSTASAGSVGVRTRGRSRESIVSLAISPTTFEQISRS